MPFDCLFIAENYQDDHRECQNDQIDDKVEEERECLDNISDKVTDRIRFSNEWAMRMNDHSDILEYYCWRR